MPKSIEEILKESKELIELSRALREHSLQATKKPSDVIRRSDILSANAKEIRARHPVDLHRK